MDVRLVSYNVHCFPWISTQIRDIVKWVTANADIVALQEVWCRHSAWSSAFAAHGWTFLRPSRENHIASIFGSGLAIAYRTGHWAVSDARLYPYVSAVGLDTLVTKGWFHVDLRNSVTGRILRILNTHMQADYDICDELWRPIAESVRIAQAAQLISVESRLVNVPTLIVGDMNTNQCWFPDCAWLTRGAGPTFDNQTIDHCAAWRNQSWALLSHRVARECGEWSDHWPVAWTLRFRASDRGLSHQVLRPQQQSLPHQILQEGPHLHQHEE
jgi:endonuclease/exonuclease/phosphatase family metal-dependent hydrolase